MLKLEIIFFYVCISHKIPSNLGESWQLSGGERVSGLGRRPEVNIHTRSNALQSCYSQWYGRGGDAAQGAVDLSG